MNAARWFLVFLCLVWICSGAFSLQGGEDEALTLYDKAYSFYEKGKWKKAASQLDRLLERYPDAEVVPLGLYLRGKIREQLGENAPPEGPSQREMPSSERMPSSDSAISPSVPPPSSQQIQTEAIRPSDTEKQVPLPSPPVTAVSEGVRITVSQVPGVNLRLSVDRVDVRCGTEVEIPFQVTNTGNGPDGFALTNGTGHKGLTLRMIGEDGTALSQTPSLQPNASFDGRIVLGLSDNTDDEVVFEPVVVARSLHDGRVKSAARISITGRRPRLSCISQADRAKILPGQELGWLLQAKNEGSVRAVSVDVTCQYPGELTLVSTHPEPTLRDDTHRQLAWKFDEILPSQNFQTDLRFKLSSRALARQELRLWSSVSSQLQREPQTSLSQPVQVGYVPGIDMEMGRTSMTVTPGDVLLLPVQIVNLGNGAENYELLLSGMQGSTVTDGGSETAALQNLLPMSRADMKVRIQIPSDASDGQSLRGTIHARAKGREQVAAQKDIEILVSAPRVETVTGVLSSAGRPGGTFHYVVQVSNNGTGLAKDVLLQETYQEGLRFMSASPMASEQGTNAASWRIPELGPGASIQISVQAGIAAQLPAGAVLGTKTVVQWHDVNGNVYP